MTLGGGALVRPGFDLMSGWIEGRAFWFVPAVLILIGGWLVYPRYRQLVTTGATYEHWSRFIVMSFAVETAVLLLITRGLCYILDVLDDRLVYLNGLLQGKLASRAPEDEVRAR
jgi:hypothetical protein